MGEIIFKIISIAIRAISPELRQVLRNVFVSLEDAAKKTDNKFDDVLVAILGAIFDISD